MRDIGADRILDAACDQIVLGVRGVLIEGALPNARRCLRPLRLRVLAPRLEHGHNEREQRAQAREESHQPDDGTPDRSRPGRRQ